MPREALPEKMSRVLVAQFFSPQRMTAGDHLQARITSCQNKEHVLGNAMYDTPKNDSYVYKISIFTYFFWVKIKNLEYQFFNWTICLYENFIFLPTQKSINICILFNKNVKKKFSLNIFYIFD